MAPYEGRQDESEWRVAYHKVDFCLILPVFAMRYLSLLLVVILVVGCQPESPQDAPHSEEVYFHEAGDFDAEQVPRIDSLRTAAQQGDLDAQFKLAFFTQYMEGEHAEAVETFKALAGQGHRESAEMVAVAYQQGKGVPVDYEQAAQWLERAAALGSKKAAQELVHYRANG
jgi:hypothetical protein